MSLDADASSSFGSRGMPLEVRIRDVADVISEERVAWIDLMKINIEGGEYELLERLIGSGIVQRCAHIQVQFHSFVPNARDRRARIREMLGATHRVTYEYEFVWEDWQRAR
jgi:hypothetical protein